MPVERLRGYSIAMIAFLAPGQQGPHVWASPSPWPYSKCSTTVNVYVMFRVETLSV